MSSTHRHSLSPCRRDAPYAPFSRASAAQSTANKGKPIARKFEASQGDDNTPSLVDEMMDYWDKVFKSQIKSLHELWQHEAAARIELQVRLLSPPPRMLKKRRRQRS